MRRDDATARLRVFGLAAAVVVLSGAAIWNDAWTHSRAASEQRARTTVVDPGTTLVVPSFGEAKIPSPWMPFAALGMAVAVALVATGRRSMRPVRASFPARRRLVHASGRAPPASAVRASS
jgi:hypothetical protein